MEQESTIEILIDNITVTFYTNKGLPELPVKYGFFYHKGWDIPTEYAIDSDNQAWVNNAHGDPLAKCSKEELILKALETESDTYEVYKALGLEPPQPFWYKIALLEGWTPPKGLIIKE